MNSLLQAEPYNFLDIYAGEEFDPQTAFIAVDLDDSMTFGAMQAAQLGLYQSSLARMDRSPFAAWDDCLSSSPSAHSSPTAAYVPTRPPSHFPQSASAPVLSSYLGPSTSGVPMATPSQRYPHLSGGMTRPNKPDMPVMGNGGSPAPPSQNALFLPPQSAAVPAISENLATPAMHHLPMDWASAQRLKGPVTQPQFLREAASADSSRVPHPLEVAAMARSFGGGPVAPRQHVAPSSPMPAVDYDVEALHLRERRPLMAPSSPSPPPVGAAQIPIQEMAAHMHHNAPHAAMAAAPLASSAPPARFHAADLLPPPRYMFDLSPATGGGVAPLQGTGPFADGGNRCSSSQDALVGVGGRIPKKRNRTNSVVTSMDRERRVRPKVVAEKGGLQCRGINRKKGSRCRNAALMEYIGPRPLYCAEHISLDPDSYYSKCASIYHKAVGDSKGCREVVLKEFRYCHKHYNQAIAAMLDGAPSPDWPRANHAYQRICVLLDQLETEAAAAKRSDPDLFQRKHKLIPKFMEMKKLLYKHLIEAKEGANMGQAQVLSQAQIASQIAAAVMPTPPPMLQRGLEDGRVGPMGGP